ncbi:exonuclease 1-like [Stylophora pistillata]|uniref:exonuclease 1-like n=1 Tax=Stylophora pistillata TaxID=50429 RepID=UPI000C052DF2|nr:exonuclease 1-like [Stylophora pistillata]
MAVNCLWPFLEKFSGKVNLREFSRQTAAIDASCWIHRALYLSISQSGNRERFDSIFQSYLQTVTNAGVRPLVVFDGLPLPAKAICLSVGIIYVVSPYESDAQIAFLLGSDCADFAITEDSDLLAYSCKKVCALNILPLFRSKVFFLLFPSKAFVSCWLFLKISFVLLFSFQISCIISSMFFSSNTGPKEFQVDYFPQRIPQI